jgi:sugar lactone lactonase YvrE
MKRPAVFWPSCGGVALGCLLGSCTPSVAVTLELSDKSVTVQHPALYPETIQYDSRRRKFLVGSFREGAIYRVDEDGRASRLVDDPRLCSVLGIALDAERGQLWAVNSDLGASLKPSAAGPKRLAAVGVYDAATGAVLEYVDLAALLPGPHLLNGLALDAEGNAYVTDSFAPAIYKITAAGQASVFLQDSRFAGEGINLNGLVVHPDGYLLVIKKSDGALFKVPLRNPASFAKVQVPTSFVGGDGVTLLGGSDLLIIANQTPAATSNAASWLSTDDGWVSAKVRASQPLGAGYPTTAVVQGQKIFVVSSRLNELIQAPPDKKAQLAATATLRQIGRLER